MIVLTASECECRWRSTFGFTPTNFNEPAEEVEIGNIDDQPAARVRYRAGAFAAWVSRTATDDFPNGFTGEALIFVTEWSISEQSEHLPLYEAWRDAYAGLTRPHEITLESHPGYLFEPGEFDAPIGLIMLALLFGWGLRLGDTGTGRHLMFNHDGTVFASHSGSNPAEHERLRKSLR